MSATNSRRIPLDKRKRTEISCDVCKGRKQKCYKPLGKGTCRYCQDRGIECTTTQIRKHRMPEGVKGLGTRLALLESLVKGLIPEADLSSNDEMRGLARTIGIMLPKQDEKAVDGKTSLTTPDEERLLQDHEGRIQYIGPGSSYFFMMKLRSMCGHSGPNMNCELCLTLGHHSLADETPDLAITAAVSQTPVHEHASPKDELPGMSDSVTNTLVDAFFEHVHADYPVLHEASFRETYEQWPASSTGVDRAWLCSLLCVLILGRRVASITVSSEQDERWWSQASALLPTVLFTSSVSAVQALMLASLHLHNIKHRDACWTLTGAAVRISFAIGLHRHSVGNMQTPLTRELRKSVWWTLYSFELMQVSSHDRPSAIENSMCSVECPKVSILDLGLPPDYIIWSNRLIVILGSACRALRTLRKTFTEDAPIGPLSPVTGLLRELDSWKLALPAHLSLESINILPPSYQRPLLLLHLQYHYIVSLVSRSALLSRVAMLSTKPNEALLEETPSMANVCIASGRTSCDLLQKLDSIDRFSAVIWWDIYYTYSSTLILVLNSICDIMKGDKKAAAESRRYLGECASLAAKHLNNPMIPATMLRWATTVIELNEMATDFAYRFESKSPISALNLPVQPAGDLNHWPPEAVDISSAPYGEEPGSIVVPTPMDGGARNSVVPWTQSQLLDLESALLWGEFHWEGIEDMLLGDQKEAGIHS